MGNKSGKDGKEAAPEKETPSSPQQGGASSTGGGTLQKGKPIPSSSQSKSPVTHQIHSGLPQQKATDSSTTPSVDTKPDKTPWRKPGKGGKSAVESLVSHSLSPTPADSNLAQNIDVNQKPGVNKQASDSSSINSRGGQRFRDHEPEVSSAKGGGASAVIHKDGGRGISQKKDDKSRQKKSSQSIPTATKADLDRRKDLNIQSNDGTTELLPPPSTQPLSRTTAVGVVTRAAAVPKFQKKNEPEKSFEFGTTFTPKTKTDQQNIQPKALEKHITPAKELEKLPFPSLLSKKEAFSTNETPTSEPTSADGPKSPAFDKKPTSPIFSNKQLTSANLTKPVQTKSILPVAKDTRTSALVSTDKTITVDKSQYGSNKPPLLSSQSVSFESQDFSTGARPSRHSLDEPSRSSTSSRESSRSRSRRRSDELSSESKQRMSEIYAIEDPRARAAALAAIHKPTNQEPSHSQVVMTAQAKAALEGTDGKAKKKKVPTATLR